MIPQIKAKFRTRNGIKYAIENLCGRQYRCHHCGNIFYSEKEIFRHFEIDLNREGKTKKNKIPKLYDNVAVNLFYSEDVKDELKQKYLKTIKTKSK
ncbi:MAG: hypothetical protein JW917_00160 [Ignavibacteria bacterium]|nr:hypothetical protein [Ignavibacteria bacterium]